MNILTWDGLADIDSFHGERVMIIDDNEINLEVMQTIFNDFGLHTDAFVSGQKALESYQNSEPFSYQFILIDLNLYGMDGYDIAKFIRNADRQDSKEIPIYAVTANLLPSAKMKATECEMNGYVDKPVNYAALLEMIQACWAYKFTHTSHIQRCCRIIYCLRYQGILRIWRTNKK